MYISDSNHYCPWFIHQLQQEGSGRNRCLVRLTHHLQASQERATRQTTCEGPIFHPMPATRRSNLCGDKTRLLRRREYRHPRHRHTFDHLLGDGGNPLGKTCVPPRVRLQAGLHHVKRNDGEVSRRATDCPARREEPKIDRRQASLLRNVSEGLQAARSVNV